MAQLRQDYEKFQNQNTTILVVGPEDAGSLEQYCQDNNLPFIGLPDPEHRVLMVYGQEIKLLKFGRMPAMVIVDLQGMVRFLHYGRSMADIPKNNELLGILESINLDYGPNFEGF